MDPVAILVIGGLVFPARLFPVPTDRTTQYMAIATTVAGAGKPDCRARSLRNTRGSCFPKYSVRRGKQINAWAFDGNIEFSSGAIGRLTGPEFAMLAGHEIAHFYLGHTHSSVTNELEADMLGALLTCRAGYRIEAAEGSIATRVAGDPIRHQKCGARLSWTWQRLPIAAGEPAPSSITKWPLKL